MRIKWMEVSRGLPARDGEYLVCVSGHGRAEKYPQRLYVATLSRDRSAQAHWSVPDHALEIDVPGWGYRVTHWAPLPALPQ